MSDQFSVRVKFNQVDRKIAVIRFRWNDDKTHLLGKDCLNSVGQWVSIGDGQGYLWDEITDILLLYEMLSDPADWKLLHPK